MHDFKKIESDVSKIYRIINEKKCFQESDFNERYQPQLQRNMIQFKNISTKLLVVKSKSKEYLNWYKVNMPKFRFDESDFQLEVMTLFCQHGLSTFELLKRFLLNTMNLTEINTKTNSKLKVTSMLGDVVSVMKKITVIKNNQINDLINVEFRNTLAHDSWYFENSIFKFKNTKGISCQLSIDEVYSSIVRIWFVNKTFIEMYTKEYYPESVEFYNKELSTIMNEAIPLYPDD